MREYARTYNCPKAKVSSCEEAKPLAVPLMLMLAGIQSGKERKILDSLIVHRPKHGYLFEEGLVKCQV